mmetsp:Transcript_5569/g.7853  ORF Transcript_5569/g.7853 Transcript_5569/m.7853 type:complete len:126 (+) Transcript_5569:222-599(+)
MVSGLPLGETGAGGGSRSVFVECLLVHRLGELGPGGWWQVFLKVKRQHRISFDTDVILYFNNLEVKTLSAKEFSSLPAEEWTLLELGPFCGPGMLAVKLEGEDCRLRGQNSKYGLYFDQLVAQPS